jgi:hypothetical protein
MHDGGLHTGTRDGWRTGTVSPDRPHDRVPLSDRGDPYRGREGSTWWHVFHADHSELRASGFSPAGTTLVVATRQRHHPLDETAPRR